MSVIQMLHAVDKPLTEFVTIYLLVCMKKYLKAKQKYYQVTLAGGVAVTPHSKTAVCPKKRLMLAGSLSNRGKDEK